MTAKVYSLSARRMVKPEPGEVEIVDASGGVWVWSSPDDAIKWARAVSAAAHQEKRRAKLEAESKGASPLWTWHADSPAALKRSTEIAQRHGLDVADVWTKPTPRTHEACVELWDYLGDCATTIAEKLDISVHGVRRDLRKVRAERERRWLAERAAKKP